METPQFTSEETPPKKNRTLLIITVVVMVLACCCIILAVAGYFSFITIRTTETQTSPLEDATPEYQLPDTDTSIGDAPVGGLGNDILRNDTWQYVGFAAIGLGCDRPVGEDSTIEVLQEPENGVWLEKWTVACASGESHPFEVEFILDDTGATFNIISIP